MIRRMLACRPRTGAVILAAGIVVGSAAAAPALHAQSLEHDTSLPIEITADSLEVLRNQQIATFTGNVDAVQGDMVLSADLLRVHYGGDDAAPGTGGRRIDPSHRGRGQRLLVVAAGDGAGQCRRVRCRVQSSDHGGRGRTDPRTTT